MELARLKEPFAPADIEWRVQSSGERNGKPWAMVLAYVQSRAIMDRLDEVCGPENWKCEYTPAPQGGIMCKLSIRVGDEWVTKEDGAENTAIEAVKGGISSALKRAGVPWGIGRYLYRLEAGWAQFDEKGEYSAKIKVGGKDQYLKWNPPTLPDWAKPSQKTQQQPDSQPVDMVAKWKGAIDSAINKKEVQTQADLTAWRAKYTGIAKLPEAERKQVNDYLDGLANDMAAAQTIFCANANRNMRVADCATSECRAGCVAYEEVAK